MIVGEAVENEHILILLSLAFFVPDFVIGFAVWGSIVNTTATALNSNCYCETVTEWECLSCGPTFHFMASNFLKF
jgi:hypothetical protein